MTKLLVASGRVSDNPLASVEIINLDELHPNLICENLPDLKLPMFSSTGKLLNDQFPIICGGVGSSYYCDCQTYVNSSWHSIPSLHECKYGSASVAFANPNMIADEVLLVTGGYTGLVLSTTESYDGEEWNQTMFAQLPTNIFFHCLEKINNTMLLQMGGSVTDNPAGTTTNTYFLDILENKWTSGKS
jgi:hypothetical protein